MGLTWRPLRRSSTGLIPLGYPNQTDACWARSPRGLAPWTCRTRGNLFTCATKICRLEATLGMDSSNVHFFQDCQKCDKLKVWGIFINLPQRHILDEMSMLSKSLFYPLKKLSLSCSNSRRAIKPSHHLAIRIAFS